MIGDFPFKDAVEAAFLKFVGIVRPFHDSIRCNHAIYLVHRPRKKLLQQGIQVRRPHSRCILRDQ